MGRFKLGLKPWRDDPRTLRFSRYMGAQLPPAKPEGDDWSLAISSDWQMLGNDRFGDCFWAAIAHLFMADGANADGMPTFDTAGVLEAYGACTGFDPATGANDNGTDPIDGLNFCRKVGIRDTSGKYHKIGAWAQVDHRNQTEVRQAMDLFGALMIGISCPNSWESSSLWDRATDDGSTAGGHAIAGVARDRAGAPIHGIKVVSWNMEQWLGWDAADRIMFIAAVIAPDWIDDIGQAPSGLNMAALVTDLNLVTA